MTLLSYLLYLLLDLWNTNKIQIQYKLSEVDWDMIMDMARKVRG